MAEAPIIDIVNLEKRYRSKNTDVFALQGINLAINKGDIFGVIGKSGAGKSTLVRCINMLERPTGGSIFFEGKDMCRLSESELRAARRSMGMIFQQFNLLMQRTARQNVCFPLELIGMDKVQARKRAEELLDLVGLANRMDSYPSQLSGGQKQRVAIARALATNPQVLLCDEATSALDPATTDSILSLIKDINRDLGITAVIITHEMSVIEKICSHVAIIHRGKIVEHGEVEEVFFHPRTEAARRLVMPEALQNLPQENLYRQYGAGMPLPREHHVCRYPRHRRYRLWPDGVAAARMPGIAPEHPGIRQIQEHPAGGDEACLIRPLWKCSWKGWWIPCT